MGRERERSKVPVVATVVVLLCGVLLVLFVVTRLRNSRNDSNRTGPGAAAGGTVEPDDEAAGPSGGSDGTRAIGDRRDTPIGREGEALLQDGALQTGIIQREYLTLTPSWVAPDSALPIVVALHGLTVDRFAMLDAAAWRAEVQRRGFVAVFPQGFGNSWNVGPCCPPANLLQVDDVAFLDSVIAAAKSLPGVDPERVYLTGFSAGALMTYRYACERAAVLRAIAPIAGVNLTRCSPGRPLALLHQHSDPDPVVPFDGSIGVGQLVSSEPTPAVLDTVGAWAAANGCTTESKWTAVVASVDEMIWRGCRGDAAVRLIRLKGLGHEWPRTADYDGLAGMLDFFGIR